MARCNHCQAQLLEYLYDLLETADRQALEEHLKACNACQAALLQAQAQRQLLAQAAKLEFAGVRFQAPAETAVAEARVLPLRPVREAKQPLKRWFMAAGILFALACLGGSGA